MDGYGWKQKAKERRLENKELHSRKQELISSRNNWKRKYMEEKRLTESLQRELRALKKN